MNRKPRKNNICFGKTNLQVKLQWVIIKRKTDRFDVYIWFIPNPDRNSQKQFTWLLFQSPSMLDQPFWCTGNWCRCPSFHKSFPIFHRKLLHLHQFSQNILGALDVLHGIKISKDVIPVRITGDWSGSHLFISFI